MKNTACLRFSEIQKSELGREAAPIGLIHFAIMLESPAGGGCGLLNDSERATFRHFSQCSQVYGHAKSGQPEGLLTRDRTELYLTFSWKKQSKALRQIYELLLKLNGSMKEFHINLRS